MIHLGIGRREQGKTTLLYYLATQPRFPFRLMFDPRKMVQRDGVLIVRTTHELVNKGMPALLLDGGAEVVYQPNESDMDHAFRVFARQVKYMVQYFPRRSLAVLVDEVSFVDLNEVDFQWALKCSKRDSAHIFMTAHRPNDFPTRVRAIADYWYLFPCRQAHDLRDIEDRTGKQVTARVERLGPREFIRWDDSNGTSASYTRPERWYVNLDPHGRTNTGVAVDLEELDGTPAPLGVVGLPLDKP